MNNNAKANSVWVEILAQSLLPGFSLKLKAVKPIKYSSFQKTENY